MRIPPTRSNARNGPSTNHSQSVRVSKSQTIPFLLSPLLPLLGRRRRILPAITGRLGPMLCHLSGVSFPRFQSMSL